MRVPIDSCCRNADYRRAKPLLAAALAMFAYPAMSALAVTPGVTCAPATGPQTVASSYARLVAGREATPKLVQSFDWPDTAMYAVPVGNNLEFFASDGACHSNCGGPNAGPNGDATRTIGTLTNPLGTTAPADVAIEPNSNPAVNPNYSSYTYIGGGPVYLIPAGEPGAGSMLMVYHAEINTNTSFYSLLGLAVSSDNGSHWTDIGEIIRPNQPYAKTDAGFAIGDPRLVVSPDQQYVYIHFADWPAGQTGKYTVTSVARASIASVLNDAFGSSPHAAPFYKYYDGTWTQPGIGGASTDLMPHSTYGGQHAVYPDTALGGYVMIMDDTQRISISLSSDGLTWSDPTLLGAYGNNQTRAEYGAALGYGSDPNNLGSSFNVYYTEISNWSNASVQSFKVTCN